jgi:hypothetical protein
VAVIEGAQSRSGGLQNAGAPAAGTDEVQTLTIGGTPTGGTFRLSYDGRKTTDIPWANVNATLIASIDAALEALPNLGAGAVVTAVGSMTAGIGTATITFSGTTTAKKSHPTILVERNDLTGTAPTVAVAETTPGVDQTGRGAAKGTLLADVTNGILYINTGTADAPTWTKVGTQT